MLYYLWSSACIFSSVTDFGVGKERGEWLLLLIYDHLLYLLLLVASQFEWKEFIQESWKFKTGWNLECNCVKHRILKNTCIVIKL